MNICPLHLEELKVYFGPRNNLSLTSYFLKKLKSIIEEEKLNYTPLIWSFQNSHMETKLLSANILIITL